MSKIPDEVVERVARAIAEAEGYISGQDPITFVPLKWDELEEPGPEREHARKLARAALRECGWAEMHKDAERYRWLRNRDLDTINKGGVFAGRVPENVVCNGDDLDQAIDAALSKAKGEGQ